MSCTRCTKSHSTVQAFLLACHDCNRKWHHRCHIPPVSDQELVSRIKAHNAGDVTNGLQGWTCKRCTKGGTASLAGTPTPRASAGPSSDTRAQPISRSSSLRDISTVDSHRPTISLPSDATQPSPKPSPSTAPSTRTSRTSTIQDDNEVIVIDGSDSDSPPSKPSKSAKTTISESRPTTALSRSSSRKTATIAKAVKSATRLSKPVHPLAREEEESSDSSAQNPPPLPQRPLLPPSNQMPAYRQTPLSITNNTNDAVTTTNHSRPRKKRASEAAVGSSSRAMTPSQPLSLGEKEVKREAFKRQAVENEKRRRFEHRQRQQEFFRAKSEEKEPQLERITTHVVDLTLDTPGRQTQAHPSDATSGPPASTAATLPAEKDTQTSPIVVSMTRTAVEKESQKEPELDLLPQWIHVRKLDGDIWDRAAERTASAVPPCHPRRKFQARKLGDAQPHIYRFDSIQWIENMKRGSR